jgi:hypothetical protein
MPGTTSLGHSWFPINLDLDLSRKKLFATFSGFRPRLLSHHIREAYSSIAVDPQSIGFVPPLLMRFQADTFQPDVDNKRGHLSYGEPVAIAVAGNRREEYVLSFSPEVGLRIYPADDLSYAMLFRPICSVGANLILGLTLHT